MPKSSKLPWADLHSHSQASDGSLAPAKLVLAAKERGLFGLCITDHDTIASYAEAIPVAQKIGLRLGAGVEFSCVFEEQDVHLLGYDFHLSSPDIKILCTKHHKRRADRNQKMIEKLRLNGFPILEEELKGETIGRPHIAQLMVQKGYVTSIKEAFNRYLGEEKPCYVQGEGLTVDETIEVIHAAHGKAFLAHPHLLSSSFPIQQLLEKPFDGLECWYAKLSKKSASPWIEIAIKRKWLMSGGSDFHGTVKPETSLGSQGVDKATFDQIFEHPLV